MKGVLLDSWEQIIRDQYEGFANGEPNFQDSFLVAARISNCDFYL